MRALAACLALLAPLLVIGLGTLGITDWADSKEADARRNAGHVLNGNRTPLPVAEVIDAKLDALDDPVLVLGNSMANNAVQPRLLGEQLRARKRLQMLTVPGSIGAHWYAMLKHRVYDRGHRPALVLIVSSLQTLLESTPTSTAARLNLDALAAGIEDPTLAKAEPRGLSMHWLHKHRANRDKVRSFTLETIRGLGVGLLLHDPVDPRSPLTQGMRLAELAHAKTFATSKLDFSVHDPTLFRGLPTTNLTAERLPHPDDSFLPEIVRLTQEHGTKLVFVRTPLSPLVGPSVSDVVPAGFEERVVSLLEEADAKYLDFGDMELGASAYKDPIHMRPSGAQRFTQLMGARLKQWQAHVPRVSWWTPRFEPDGVSPGAAGAPLEPGEGRVLTFESPWPGPSRRVKLEAVFHPVEAHRSAIPPVLMTGGTSVRMEWRDDAWHTDSWVPRSDAMPWTVTLQAGGEAIVPTTLIFGDFEQAAYVIGDKASHKGPAVTLVGEGHPQFSAKVPPPAVPGGTEALFSGPRASGVLPFPGFATVLDGLVDLGDAPAACSPVRILENGEPLISRGVTCARLAHSAGGRSCFDGDRVAFTTTDRRPPTTNGRRYDVELHPERACGSRVWLYPGDVLRFEASADAISALKLGADKLAMSILNGVEPPDLGIRVLARGHPILELNHQHDGKGSRSGFLRRFTLPAPDGEPLVVELSNLSDDRFALLTHLAIRQ